MTVRDLQSEGLLSSTDWINAVAADIWRETHDHPACQSWAHAPDDLKVHYRMFARWYLNTVSIPPPTVGQADGAGHGRSTQGDSGGAHERV